jgi:hypothetical protein
MKKFLNAMRNAQRVDEQRKRASFHPQRNTNAEDEARSLATGCETEPCGDQTQQKKLLSASSVDRTQKKFLFELPSVSSQATDQELSDLAQSQRKADIIYKI